MRKGIIIGLLLVSGYLFSQQDYPISYATAASMQINPAYVGFSEAHANLGIYYKNQANQGGIQSIAAIGELSLLEKRAGFGAQFLSNTLSRTALQDITAQGFFSYRLMLLNRSYQQHYLQLGLSMGMRQVGFSVENMTFGSQYDPAYSGSYNPNLIPAGMQDETRRFFDANFGAVWKGVFSEYAVADAGFALWHIVPQQQNFYDNDEKTPIKFSVNARLALTYGELCFLPSALFSAQGGVYSAEIGSFIKAISKNNFDFGIAVFFRHSRNTAAEKKATNVMIPAFSFSYANVGFQMATEFYVKNSFSSLVNFSVSYTFERDDDRNGNTRR